MCDSEDIFSMRLVVADFYMEKPINGLDTCYSELHGQIIKKVPVIRIFGSSINGQKTCMHVHGVFPYFYIPYEQTECDSMHKFTYQIALHIDKAINISLGHGSSSVQHVFKVQPVKGIPFYGYHRAEHQFLKIYMFNPRFVRRVANLLQNGAIMGKKFQPYESHLSFVLQFMIDYNLYGMSLLHVPSKLLKIRCFQPIDFASLRGLTVTQLLDCNKITKMSTCALELDIAASSILNRFQLNLKPNTHKKEHSNPGIEALWRDEQIRRDKLLQILSNDKEKLKNIPVLELPTLEIRTNIPKIESEIFHRTVLINKLLSKENSSATDNSYSFSNQTSTLSQNESELKYPKQSEKSSRKMFNLSKLLENSVYPQECSQDTPTDHLINASVIQNHLFNDKQQHHLNLDNELKNYESNHDENKDRLFEKTIIDEQMVLNLTQTTNIPFDATLREEDFQLLEVLQELEEAEEDYNVGGHKIDLDSSLAPLSQSHDDIKVSAKLQMLHKEKSTGDVTITEDDTEIYSNNDNKIDNDNEADESGHDFDYSIILDDVDSILLKLTQTTQQEEKNMNKQMIQVDGSNDLTANTPTKLTSERLSYTPVSKRSNKHCESESLMRSPRTTHKFRPLPLVITKTGEKETFTTKSTIPLRKKLARKNLRRKNIIDDLSSTPNKDTRDKVNINDDFEKTYITCALTPVRSRAKRLRVYSVPKPDDKFEAQSNENDKLMQATKINEQNRETADISEIWKNDDKESNEIINNSINEEHHSLNCSTSQHKEKMLEIKNVRKNLKYLYRRKSSKIFIGKNNDYKVNNDKSSFGIKECRVKLKRLRENDLSKIVDKTLTEQLSNLIKHLTKDLQSIDRLQPSTLSMEKSLENVNGEFISDLKGVNKNHLIDESKGDSHDDSDTEIHSFYEDSFLFSSNSSPSIKSVQLDNISDVVINENTAVLVPLIPPPTREEVLLDCRRLQLPELQFQQPFYSNPDDISKPKEVGFTLLHILGNKINDLDEFTSVMGMQLCGLNLWRREKYSTWRGSQHAHNTITTHRIREYLGDCRKIVMMPFNQAPSRHDVKLWLKAREILHNRNKETNEDKICTSNPMDLVDADSPIKVTRQKVTMMLTMDEDNSLQNTSQITLDHQDGNKEHDITISKSLNKISELGDNFYSQAEKFSHNKHGKSLFMQKSYLESSNESSVNSEAVMAALERSSFRQQIEENYTFSDNRDSIMDSNSCDFKVALENLHKAKSDLEFTYLTIIVLELFVMTRNDLYPDPKIDPIYCLFYAIEHSNPISESDNNTKNNSLQHKACGYIIVLNQEDDLLTHKHRKYGLDPNIEVTVVKSEIEALHSLISLCTLWDPDIFAGYEIEMASWGYVIERAKFWGMNISPLLSRIPQQKTRDIVDEERDQFTDLDIETKLCGRILLDVWRLMRFEITLTSYTFENVMYHILHKRCPAHSYRILSTWFKTSCSRWIVLEYYLERVRGTLALLEQLDLIGRTSEMAKLIGIQFYEVLSRGSQFRVESMMLRIAKPRNLVPISPSVQQRAHMRAPEYLPLIMEPYSRYYADPLIVLDFQSLYPSMIIAYNYCFSTCLGRIQHLGDRLPFEFGASQLRVSPNMLRKLVERDLVHVSPCGVAFVKKTVREGILPRLLTEILDTRQMVKQSMKLHSGNSHALQRILHSRQLALKLMANVTYGYTAANFSGRMPSVEVGDSIVAKGRETLERAINLVETNKQWNVKVVYGDTDSIFVLVPGRSRNEAFQIGEEIVKTVTEQNPYPVKLKLEKVYQPCILQTKKRYVGYMYETVDQKEPTYEAKGIETVRRDGCPLVSKMLEKVLRILFETADVSLVKRYVCRQFTKLLSGQANLQDLIFAKEFRGLSGYKQNACVPALELTRKWLQRDPRRIPRRGERVPFIIVNGPPGLPLIRLVRHPHEVLANEGLKINAIYYITKAIIPPLNRCLLLIGADVNEWFTNLPRKILQTSSHSILQPCDKTVMKKSTITQFFSNTNCLIDCGRQTKNFVCSDCRRNEQHSVIVLQHKFMQIERGYYTTQHLCQACCGRIGDLNCNSLDCPVLYVLETNRRNLKQMRHLREVLKQF